MQVTLGGERLGSGKKNKISMRDYERSTHDLSYIWRSTMAAGTLVPFMSEVALPGDTFDINLNVDVLTHPTIGPLFGTYKIQLDVFQVPVRLYQGALHMNMLGIGMDMSKVMLPVIEMPGAPINSLKTIDNQQVNPSSIFKYLGISGMGYNGTNDEVMRRFNAVPWLGYWDIYKNYYANKQEGYGSVIHKSTTPSATELTDADFFLTEGSTPVTIPVSSTPPFPPFTMIDIDIVPSSYIILTASTLDEAFNIDELAFIINQLGTGQAKKATDLFQEYDVNILTGTIVLYSPTSYAITYVNGMAIAWYDAGNITTPATDSAPEIVTFPLTNLDDVRKQILQWDMVSEFQIDSGSFSPFGIALAKNVALTPPMYSMQYSQEGLALKTYQSDLFNNWMSTDWIDGPDGISEITAIDTSGGSFTIDELNMSKKIYDMLNRIALSGGSYDDWLDTVYTHDRHRSAENPIYLGGLISQLVFQEVISNTATADQPLGTLAGRGRTGNKRKGGEIVAKIDEPSYLMGIVSLTPNIDYSQGNKWDMNLKTMNDFHKPALDEIGFQDLITDQMAWYDTELSAPDTPVYKSAGKQPAWINYMTNVNRVYGNFADQTQQMFMVLNRRYGTTYTGTAPAIQDLTTYIDPTKFNHIFADTRRDAQNFWCQIGVNITARRKMSAKVIPNL